MLKVDQIGMTTEWMLESLNFYRKMMIKKKKKKKKTTMKMKSDANNKIPTLLINSNINTRWWRRRRTRRRHWIWRWAIGKNTRDWDWSWSLSVFNTWKCFLVDFGNRRREKKTATIAQFFFLIYFMLDLNFNFVYRN